MIDGVVAWVLSKINIEYIIKHVKREEHPELPEEALREAVVNALAHRDYRSTANVQVYVFKDRVEIVSPGGLPAGMTEADLGVKSIPRNPLLFGILHRMDAVEHIGSGIKRIRYLCRNHGVAEPVIEVSEHWFTMVFPRQETVQKGDEERQLETASVPSLSQVCPKSVPSVLAEELMRAASSTVDLLTLMRLADHTNRTRFKNAVLQPLIEAGLIEMSIPDKPRSSKQKYRTTDRGKDILAGTEEDDA